jgi:uncharacterized membrane protein
LHQPHQSLADVLTRNAVDALIAHMHTGDIAAGFTAATERCATVLAAHAPPDGSANELPDRLYVM